MAITEAPASWSIHATIDRRPFIVAPYAHKHRPIERIQGARIARGTGGKRAALYFYNTVMTHFDPVATFFDGEPGSDLPMPPPKSLDRRKCAFLGVVQGLSGAAGES